MSICETLDTSTATGRMVINLIAAVGQWEREAVGERPSMLLAHKRGRCQVYGRTPFGWRREGDFIVKDAVQQAELTIMRTMLADGSSYNQVAAFMNGGGKSAMRTLANGIDRINGVAADQLALQRIADLMERAIDEDNRR